MLSLTQSASDIDNDLYDSHASLYESPGYKGVCPIISKHDESNDKVSLNESIGNKRFNNTSIINRIRNQSQPDCPICTYQFKPFYKDRKKVKPNTECCPLCGFDFVKYRSSNYNIEVPTLLQSKLNKFNDTNLNKKIHKKWQNEESIKSKEYRALENRLRRKRCVRNKENDCPKLLSIIQIAKRHAKLLNQQVM